MTDVLFCQTADEGDIESIGGVVSLTGGFESAVYISLFGGRGEWWGDLQETDPAYKLTGETENTLKGVAAIPANLRRVEQAAQRDLTWMKDVKAANEITVVATMPGVNKIGLSVAISARGKESIFEYTENWKWQS